MARAWLARAVRVGTISLLALVLALPAVAGSISAATTSPRSAPPTPSSLVPDPAVDYFITWDGVNVASASTPSTAFSLGLNGVTDLLYTWSHVLTGGGPLINDARLQMRYLGFALATRDVTSSVANSSGQIPMNWTAGSIQDLLVGLYGVTASLLAPNGTTIYSENFYVILTAPYRIVAAAPIILLVLGAYEIYAACCSGGHYRAAVRPGRPTYGQIQSPAAPVSPPPAAPAPAAGVPPEAPPPPSPPPPSMGGST